MPVILFCRKRDRGSHTHSKSHPTLLMKASLYFADRDLNRSTGDLQRGGAERGEMYRVKINPSPASVRKGKVRALHSASPPSEHTQINT